MVIDVIIGDRQVIRGMGTLGRIREFETSEEFGLERARYKEKNFESLTFDEFMLLNRADAAALKKSRLADGRQRG